LRVNSAGQSHNQLIQPLSIAVNFFHDFQVISNPSKSCHQIPSIDLLAGRAIRPHFQCAGMSFLCTFIKDLLIITKKKGKKKKKKYPIEIHRVIS